jgi:hypothetical protein
MFDQTSRYASTETASQTFTGSDGVLREIRYIRRRFLSPASNFSIIQDHNVILGDRMDSITAQYFGDPTQFWLICDANEAMNPFDLIARPGQKVGIPVPQFQV